MHAFLLLGLLRTGRWQRVRCRSSLSIEPAPAGFVGDEELEPGEVDHKRSGLFTRCMHAENRKAGSRTGSQPQPWKQGATVDASGQQRAV